MQNYGNIIKKGNLTDLPIITIHIKDDDKQALTKDAEKLGMQLTTYCRMKLLETLKK
jgi:hypothetical protein